MVCIRNLEKKDVKEAAKLEASCFPEDERASEAKIRSRVSNNQALQLGLIAPTANTSMLIGHLLTTRTSSDFVTMESMEKNDSNGSNVALHSVTVHPAHRGQGYARKLIEELIFRCQTIITPRPKRVSLLAHKELIPMYEKLGFSLVGKSECQFGNSEWHDMIYEL
ncbi:polyamine N-acetyltransferase [Schizosaccharomyces japonicus yFS275]|uniref:Polyamine N-acetyltransferase n=1 Tax=Schizosaccharomyces japonicus (strain yFS275 / FY16936) TaxID=402676 RepID=B6K232_SCHJY|nr:polyamine N-acetyltransferase [Schizosaccharomyces japonicus yFS275]EEB07213.1 polyamine N-acetyltransferase [Schizosaccharomyces japonicus yFS275]